MNLQNSICFFIDATFALDNPSQRNLQKSFQKESFGKNIKIRDKKLQYDINREAAKITALSSGKICKYEYLTDEQMLPSNQR